MHSHLHFSDEQTEAKKGTGASQLLRGRSEELLCVFLGTFKEQKVPRQEGLSP